MPTGIDLAGSGPNGSKLGDCAPSSLGSAVALSPMSLTLMPSLWSSPQLKVPRQSLKSLPKLAPRCEPQLSEACFSGPKAST